MTVQEENIRGSNLTGTDGTANRTYTLSNTDVQTTGMEVFINGAYAHQGGTEDYTYAAGVITFKNVIFNDQYISIHYHTGTDVEPTPTPGGTATGIMASLQGLLWSDRGEWVRIKKYVIADTGSYYDDSYSLSFDSEEWTRGMQQPVNGNRNSYEARLLEQGKITTNDSRLYMLGDVGTSGTILKIGIGSPVRMEYSVLEGGVEAWPLGSSLVYKKMYIRYLQTGSLDKE
jgi:hypothetical protein